MISTVQVITQANELLAAHAALVLRIRSSQQNHRRQLHSLQPPPLKLLSLSLIPSSPPSPTSLDDSPPSSPEIQPAPPRQDLPPAKRARVARYHNYVPEEETIRNDYSQRYVDGGEWPQSWVLGAEPERRFEEYPKQQRLLNLKKASVNLHSLPPSYLSYSSLTSLHPLKFDVILLDPPFSSSFTWDHLQELPIPSLAGDPSFVFLWVGSGAGEGLERGREILAKWGYRRCEDVVWVKTNNTTSQGPGTDAPTTSLLTRTKQHCLIGIRGTVRRSLDSWFVHCNVDTDVIIWEGDPTDPTRKPPEMYSLIENFCLGIRRLEIFGRTSSLRRGWVTVLGDVHLPLRDGAICVEGEEGGIATEWIQESWEEGIKELSQTGKAVVPMTPEIDALRPKSPVRGQSSNLPGPTTVPGSQGMQNTRFSGNRVNVHPNMQMMGPQMMMPPVMGMGAHQMGMGMGTMDDTLMPPVMGMGAHQMGMGMGTMDDTLMGGWNPMMAGTNRVRGMQAGNMSNMANGGITMNSPGMGVNGGALGLSGIPMQLIAQMVQGGGGFNQQGLPFNSSWPGNEQGQFAMDGSWENESMLGMNPGMMGGMNMNMANMGMNGMGMGQQWNGPGNF